jgi:hypothetical protein
MTVFVAGEGVAMVVSTIVVAAGDPAVPVEAAELPPSTGTTEYVALPIRVSSNTALGGTNGSANVDKENSHKANTVELEVLSRIVME